MRKLTLATLMMAGCASTALQAQAQTGEIGNVAAVNRDMAGTPPGIDRRLLLLGQEVVQDERIETTDLGSGQLLFVDQTSLTISPNTDIVLDEYVFDPATETGDVALTMTRGALRFIGGRITKKRRAIVRTPTATIGIRGGMVLIQIDANGQLQVTHLAGESTAVVSYGDTDGDGLDDGPTGDDLEAFLEGETPGGGNQLVLSRPSSTAVTEAGPDERGPDQVVFDGLAELGDLADVYASFEGNRDGGSTSNPDPQTRSRETRKIAEVNSDTPEGQTKEPLSTEGESKVAAVPESEPVDVAVLGQTPVADNMPEVLVEDLEIEVEPPVGGLPTGGSFFQAGVGIDPFVTIVEGSIIGTTASGDVVSIEVPSDVADLAETDPDGGRFLAQDRFANSGFFELAQGDASSTSLGDLTGFGFADLDNNVFFIGAENATGEPALIFFGDATPNQANAFANDPAAPAAANSITGFAIGDTDDFDGGRESFLIVSNGANGSDIGSRVLFGELEIDGDGFEDLIVLAAPLFRNGSGPVISTEALNSNNSSFGIFNETGFTGTSIGTLENAEGQTLFGPENDYFVVTSAFRENGTGDFVVDDRGEEVINSASSGTQVFPNGDGEDIEALLLTRDPTLAEVVVNPLSLATDPTGRVSGAEQGTIDIFASGFAECGSSRCVVNNGNSNTYALTAPGGGDVLLPNGSITFGAGFEEANSFLAAIVLTDDFQSGLQRGPNGGDFFAFVSDPEQSVAIDDNRFGSATVDSDGSIVAGNENETVNLIIASSGAVGDGGILPANANTSAEFYRWGWWSASLTGNDAQTGDGVIDIVHLGTFAGGVVPDEQIFGDFNNSFTGTATFNGIAVGTRNELATGIRQTIGGTSNLVYNFGQRAGTLNLSLPTENFDRDFSVSQTGGVLSPSYGGSIEEAGLQAGVDGIFLSGGGNVVAATAGQFEIFNSSVGTEIQGNFGADRQ